MFYNATANRSLVKIWRNVLFSQSSEPRSILITSALSGEGSSTIGLNLAKIMSEEDNGKIVLVEGNIRKPIVQEMFRLPNKEGLTDFILNNTPLEDIIQSTEIENFSVICSGSNKSGFFSFEKTKQFTKLLEELEQQFKIIIFDAPPVLEYPKTALISKHFEGTILVVQAHKTIRSDIEKVKNEIQKTGGKIIGVVLNKQKKFMPEKKYHLLFGGAN